MLLEGVNDVQPGQLRSADRTLCTAVFVWQVHFSGANLLVSRHAAHVRVRETVFFELDRLFESVSKTLGRPRRGRIGALPIVNCRDRVTRIADSVGGCAC